MRATVSMVAWCPRRTCVNDAVSKVGATAASISRRSVARNGGLQRGLQRGLRRGLLRGPEYFVVAYEPGFLEQEAVVLGIVVREPDVVAGEGSNRVFRFPQRQQRE